jgi:hypothetical protein
MSGGRKKAHREKFQVSTNIRQGGGEESDQRLPTVSMNDNEGSAIYLHLSIHSTGIKPPIKKASANLRTTFFNLILSKRQNKSKEKHASTR